MSWLSNLFGGHSDDEARELSEPTPLTGYLEHEATHLVWSEEADGYVYGIVENCGGRDFVVPAMRTWPDEE